MLLSAIGALFILFGLFSGAVLVLAPLGLAQLAPSLTLWVMFPLLVLIGYTLLVVGGKSLRSRGLTTGVSALLLLLAAASATGLVLAAASVLQPVGSTISLWYVFAVAGTVGAVGAASFQRDREPELAE
ncbi:MAG: hypothetical protein RLZZ618_2276 [Pseudomonadota bacterium]|jgi:hypothetical protein